uniref:Glycosyl transferase group 1 n=1 Tax=Shewanella putrefaciens (strain 200) TaxID=399804 RepID=E6XG21_SHEP2
MKLKILHLTNAFPYSGHPEYGCFIKSQIDSLDGLVESDVLFINAHSNGTLEYLKSLYKIREKVKNADVIHCHHLFSFIALKMSFSVRKPVVLSFLNDWTKEVKLNIPEVLKNILCSFFVELPDKVIFKSFIPKFLKGNKFVFLPNGVDIDFFNVINKDVAKFSLGLSKEKNYILFVSSKNLHRKQKRYDIYVKVLEHLQTNYPSYNYDTLTMSVDDRFTARNKINSASLHLLCSDYEGSPNSVKEALSSGVPVVARPAGSVEQLLKNMPYSSMAYTEDYSKIAELVHNIICNDIDRESIRRKLLEQGISTAQVAIKLYELYRELYEA